MIKNQKLIIVLLGLLLCAFVVSYFLLKNNHITLKPGDKDPETGCTIGTDGRSALCD